MIPRYNQRLGNNPWLFYEVSEPSRSEFDTALSVISSPRSMIANASRSCASVMHSGGFVKKVFQRTKVERQPGDLWPHIGAERIMRRLAPGFGDSPRSI
jgi:hypothetical protein